MFRFAALVVVATVCLAEDKRFILDTFFGRSSANGHQRKYVILQHKHFGIFIFFMKKTCTSWVHIAKVLERHFSTRSIIPNSNVRANEVFRIITSGVKFSIVLWFDLRRIN